MISLYLFLCFFFAALAVAFYVGMLVERARTEKPLDSGAVQTPGNSECRIQDSGDGKPTRTLAVIVAVVFLCVGGRANGQMAGNYGFGIQDSGDGKAAGNSRFEIGNLKGAQNYQRQVIDPRTHPHTTRNFWTLAGVDAVLTTMDALTSIHNEGRGAVEGWTPWLMGRRPGDARLSLTLAGMAAGRELAAYAFDRRGHHRLARILQAGSVGVEAAAVTNNFIWMSNHPPAALAPVPAPGGPGRVIK